MTVRPTHDEPPLRADARRNRTRILEVARKVFAADGIGVPMDAIARRARLGVGTLYRHFPTKEALFAAVVEERVVHAIDDAKRSAGDPSPGPAFFAFLDRMWTEGAQKIELIDALTSARVDVRATLARHSAEFRGALALLLRRAQATGAVRGDIGVEEVLALLAATRHAASAGSSGRVLDILRDGLRPPSGAATKRAVVRRRSVSDS